MHRICGDIDLYFEDRKSYDDAFKIINDKGLDINSMPGFSSEYMFGKFEVEHHQRMFDIHNPFVQHVLKKIRKEEVNNANYLMIKDNRIKIPSALETIVKAPVVFWNRYKAAMRFSSGILLLSFRIKG